MEVSGRRPRGWPLGAQNKPKPLVVITRDNANTLRSRVLEIASGEDIGEAVATYARRRQRDVSILSAVGSVVNVLLRQPCDTAAPGAVLVAKLRGRFEILSLSGPILPPPAPPVSSSLSVFLAGDQGQVTGGVVAGPHVAAGPVTPMVASFANVAYERLPLREAQEESGGAQSSGWADVAASGDSNVAGSSNFNFPATVGNGRFPSKTLTWAGNIARPPY